MMRHDNAVLDRLDRHRRDISHDETFAKVAGIGAQPDKVDLELMQPDVGRDIERGKGFL